MASLYNIHVSLSYRKFRDLCTCSMHALTVRDDSRNDQLPVLFK